MRTLQVGHIFVAGRTLIDWLIDWGSLPNSFIVKVIDNKNNCNAEGDNSFKTTKQCNGENELYFACRLFLVLSQVSFMHLVLLTVFSGRSVFCHPLDLLHFRLSQLFVGICWQFACRVHLWLGHLDVSPQRDGGLLSSWPHKRATQIIFIISIKNTFLNLSK